MHLNKVYSFEILTVLLVCLQVQIRCVKFLFSVFLLLLLLVNVFLLKLTTKVVLKQQFRVDLLVDTVLVVQHDTGHDYLCLVRLWVQSCAQRDRSQHQGRRRGIIWAYAQVSDMTSNYLVNNTKFLSCWYLLKLIEGIAIFPLQTKY